MKKYIHVNMHKIRSNRKHNQNEPVLTIKEGRKNTYCHEVEILGPSKVIYGGNDLFSFAALIGCEKAEEPKKTEKSTTKK